MKLQLLIALLFFVTCARSQSLDQALAEAKKNNKIVMIVVKSPECVRCNEVAEAGVSGSVAKHAIESSAILVKMEKLPEFLETLFSLYYIAPEFFGVVYMDADKNILRLQHGSSTLAQTYLDNLEKAVKEKEGGQETIATLVTKYYTRKGDFETNLKLTSKILATGLEPKDELIDELVRSAPKDSMSSLSFLQFVQRTAPSSGSVAAGVAEKDLDTYNMAWYRMTLQERSAINNRSYQKGLARAIATKDVSLMYRISGIRQNMYRASGPLVMQRVGQETFLRYYTGIKDTANYLQTATRYYDSYFMTVDVDSIKKADMNKTASLLRTAPAMQNAQQGAVVSQLVSFSPQVSFYGNALNEGAWRIYTWSKNPSLLAKALVWAKRSVEFAEVPESMDTYARLLYVTNNADAAIDWETKAIATLKTRSLSTGEYETILAKMKKGAASLDEYH